MSYTRPVSLCPRGGKKALGIPGAFFIWSILTIRVSDNELEQLRRRAQQRQITVSQLVRVAVLAKRKRDKERPNAKHLLPH